MLAPMVPNFWLALAAAFCFCSLTVAWQLDEVAAQNIHSSHFDEDDISQYSHVLGGVWPKFYQSIPENLTITNMTAANAQPVFAVMGDAMGALGFQMCDIEHYLDHENHTLPPCPRHSGWASKVVQAYGDKLWMVDHMIRSSSNAERHLVPLLLAQFNKTQNLKLVVIPLGSKYWSIVQAGHNFTEHLVTVTETFLSRGIKVMLMTRPPVNPTPPAPLWFNMYNATAAAEAAAAVRAVAAQTGAACLDVEQLFLDLGAGWKDALGPDGVHYSPLGQQVVFEGFMRVVQTQLPQLSPANIHKQ